MGSLFPEFTLYTGEIVRPADKNGMIVLFLSTTCRSCLDILSRLNTFGESRLNQSVVLCMQGGETEVKTMLEEQQISLPFLLYDSAQKEKFNVSVFPYLYLLSGGGLVVSKGTVRDAKDLGLRLNMDADRIPIDEREGEGA
ncbi:hypothetical protein J41TS12_01220 [Paenibacillus antibioticophila]|uniref:Redoxin domain-containing protein n=1 Tax=Paenibacillus antibioticophila TaxID=1274374 RepID=A0A920CCZ2_9BACL|nr:hypothetical protein J41TS12_01220 [Paenibacillus antibioticophila]